MEGRIARLVYFCQIKLNLFLSAFNQTLYNRLMPVLILALNYWLHLLATVLWLGGLTTLTLIAWPALLHLEGQTPKGRQVLDALEQRFRPLANISLIVLLVTGMIQMGGDPHYQGFLKITDAWSVGMFIKHILVVLMIVISVILQAGIQPALVRARLTARHNAAQGQASEERLYRRLRILTMLMLVLGGLVLLMTALITAL